MDFGWKKKVERLRVIILSCAPLFELDPLTARTINTMRDATRLRACREEIEGTIEALNEAQAGAVQAPRTLWEPLELYGWRFEATMYLLDGKPWWLVRATHPKAEPSDKEIKMAERIADHLGAHAERDRIMNTSFDEPNGYGMWWTWINQAPLLEIHMPLARGQAANFRIVPQGTPLPAGFELVDRNMTHGKTSR